MKFIGVWAFICVAIAAATPASAVTIDFTGAGSADGDHVSTIVSGDASLAFNTISGPGYHVHETSPYVLYSQSPVYSGDQALYAASDGDVFQLMIELKPNLTFTNITFGLGSTGDTTTRYDVWGPTFFDFIQSDTAFAVDGTTGSLITLTGLNTPSLIFQFGNHTDVGLQFISFDTAGTVAAVTPIPGALLLFITALTGLGGFAWRKRAA